MAATVLAMASAMAATAATAVSSRVDTTKADVQRKLRKLFCPSGAKTSEAESRKNCTLVASCYLCIYSVQNENKSCHDHASNPFVCFHVSSPFQSGSDWTDACQDTYYCAHRCDLTCELCLMEE
ncbi:hypothetical protein V5799_015553 [Amblyomma americanum]|uniref:Secreted protein n=1 Tax=Amblyomma americanum TaxID=6943 RepID=A0AAQ4F8Z1_AMBAM